MSRSHLTSHGPREHRDQVIRAEIGTAAALAFVAVRVTGVRAHRGHREIGIERREAPVREESAELDLLARVRPRHGRGEHPGHGSTPAPVELPRRWSALLER